MAQPRRPALSVDFLNPPGEPSLVPPNSMQWRLGTNPVTNGIGAVAAVLLEFAEPKIRSGVWDHSIFKTDPARRGQRTMAVGSAATYAPASTGRRFIDNVTRMHNRVVGETPSGEAYQAMDTELLDWVAATGDYCGLEAYHRFRRPLSTEDRNRFYRDGRAISTCFGVVNPLRSDADFFAMMDRLLPRFEAHEINFELIDIMLSQRALPGVPGFLRRALIRSGISLIPAKVRERMQLGAKYDMTLLDRLAMGVMAWLVEVLPPKNHPAKQGAARLGLPANFAWMSPAKQQAILAKNPKAAAPAAPAVPVAAE